MTIEIIKNIIDYVPEIKNEWNAQKCISEMKDGKCNNWKQTEWTGFYFEYIINRVNIPGISRFRIRFGNTSFDGIVGSSIVDYKVSLENKWIILNDQEAIKSVINEYDELVYIVLKGYAEFEKEYELSDWRHNIIGEIKINNEEDHRKLKVKFVSTKLLYLSINKDNIKYLTDFTQGINSNGKDRPKKYMIKTDDLGYFLKIEVDLKTGTIIENNPLEYINIKQKTSEKESKSICTKTNVPRENGRLSPIMESIRKILSSGKIELKDAIDKFLKIQTLKSKNPKSRARTIFLEANKYRVPTKIEKIGKETWLELILINDKEYNSKQVCGLLYSSPEYKKLYSAQTQ